MGFFGLFGGSKKKKEAPKAAAPAPVAAAPAPAVPAGTPPEVIAAISGAISMVMNDDEMIAAMAAALQHAGGGVAVVRMTNPSTLRAQSGTLSLMTKKQECYSF